MSHRKLFQSAIWIISVILLSVGCGVPKTITESSTPTPTKPITIPTSLPTTATPTPIRPIASPTPIVVGPVIKGPIGTDGFPWWNDTVFYEIFTASFRDSDGDGIGDFNGVTEKLDYLQQLGIKGIYLMMIMQDNRAPVGGPCPWRPSDYMAVYHNYGTIDDLKRLLSEAHERGIQVIMDFVMHSTSTDHPWFQSSLDPDSTYRDWYHWSDRDEGPTDWGAQAWFKADTGYYYLSIAGSEVALLNLNNTDVTNALYNVAKFWLQDVGVDGFRLDGAEQLIPEWDAAGEMHNSNTTSTHNWLKQFRQFYKSISPASMTFAEVWKPDPNLFAPYVQGDETDLVTEYDFTWAIPRSVNGGDSSFVNRALQDASQLMPNQQYVTFISNHDLDRTMSTSLAYNWGVGVGIGENPDKAKVAASLYLTAPGVPIIYWGEEIGMRGIKIDDHGLFVADNYRRVMQWSDEQPSAGFSNIYPGYDTALYIDDWNHIDVYNVASEMNDPNSLLSHYRSLIALRNTHPALRIGDLNIVLTSKPSLFASLRIAPEETVGTIINLTDKPVLDVKFTLQKSHLQRGSYKAISLMGSIMDTHLESPNDQQYLPIDLIVNENGGFSISLPPNKGIRPYGTLVFQLIKQ